MTVEEPRPTRRGEIEAILERKAGGVAETRDDADKYTVVGAVRRDTFADWLTPIEKHFVCHGNDIPDADAEGLTIALTGDAATVSVRLAAGTGRARTGVAGDGRTRSAATGENRRPGRVARRPR